MKNLINLIVVLSFLGLSNVATANEKKVDIWKKCQEEMKKACPGSQDAADCLSRNYSSFSPECVDVIVKGQPDNRVAQDCMQKITKLCGESDDANCMENQQAALGVECQHYVKNMEIEPGAHDPKEIGALKKCMPELQKSCEMDMALFEKDQNAAVQKYEECFTKALENSKGECGEMLGNNDKDYTEYKKKKADEEKKKKEARNKKAKKDDNKS